MPYKNDRKYFELYCCLPHEFSPDYLKKKTKKKCRNTNALSTRLAKCKTDNFNRLSKKVKDHYENETNIFQRRIMNKIMSIDTCDYQSSSEMADGDKNHKYQLDQSTADTVKSLEDLISHLSSPQKEQQANQISSDYASVLINHPIMLPPVNKQQSNRLIDLLSVDSTNISTQSETILEESMSRKNEDIEEVQPMIEIISDNQQPKQVHSLSESINELCLLIRKLLHYEMTKQDGTSLQTIIASQLAILLTYLTVPNNEKIVSKLCTKRMMEKMTSTSEDNISSQTIRFSNVETQTDFDWKIQQNQDLIEFDIHETSMDRSLSVKNTTSHTELVSNSTTLHLPGYRPHYALSDTFVYHIRHHYQHSSSCHQFISHSATTIQHKSTKENPFQLVRYLRKQFKHFIELESSNTCLEASTEFTPDFLLTTINSSKHDQTEQFGIDTLAVNSNEKENYDSLELDLEQNSNEYLYSNTTDFHQSNQYRNNHLLKSSITEISSLDSISESIKDDYLRNQIDFCQLLSPMLNTCQWQTPILLHKANSFDFMFEKHTAKMEFKQLKIRSNSNNEINMIGKRVRIKPNSYEQKRILSTLNYNNNYRDCSDAIDSLQLSIDSFCSSNDDISNSSKSA